MVRFLVEDKFLVHGVTQLTIVDLQGKVLNLAKELDLPCEFQNLSSHQSLGEFLKVAGLEQFVNRPSDLA